MLPKIGTNVQLVPFHPDHAEAIYSWYYDVSYEAFFRDYPNVPLEKNDFHHFGDWIAKSGNGLFVIVHKDDNKPIGLMTYTCLKSKSGIFRFGILLDNEYQRKTYAIEAIILLCFYLFENKGATKLVVEFLERDQHIERITAQGGFHKEGLLLGEALISGEYLNELRYAITKQTVHELYGAYYEQLEEASE